MRAWNWLLVFTLVMAGCGESTGGTGGTGGTDPTCGDGNVDASLDEECDDGTSNSDTVADACRLDCTNPICGDGVKDTDEECDGVAQCTDMCVSTAICGDEIVGGSEECDGGEGCLPEGHIRECMFSRTGFRMNTLGLFDPVIVAAPGACNAGFQEFINSQIATSTVNDWGSNLAPVESFDGLIDLGFVFTFADPIPQGDDEANPGAFVTSDCNRLDRPSPVPNPSPCSPTTEGEPSGASFTATSQTGDGTCLDALPGTTERTVTPVVAGDDGCFASNPIDFTVILGSLLTIPLKETVIAAQWDGDPAAGLLNGLVRGWLSKEIAETILFPELGFTFLNNQPLPVAFGVEGTYGDGMDCTTFDDNNGEEGFWVYFTFTAEPVPWEGGPMCGNGVVDEDRPEGAEACDPGIEDSCVDDCDDGFSCTDDTLNLGDPCVPRCFYRGIKDNTDGCCPLDAPQVDGAIVGGSVVGPEALADDADCLAQ